MVCLHKVSSTLCSTKFSSDLVVSYLNLGSDRVIDIITIKDIDCFLFNPINYTWHHKRCCATLKDRHKKKMRNVTIDNPQTKPKEKKHVFNRFSCMDKISYNSISRINKDFKSKWKEKKYMWMFNFKNDLDTSRSPDKVHDMYGREGVRSMTLCEIAGLINWMDSSDNEKIKPVIWFYPRV